MCRLICGINGFLDGAVNVFNTLGCIKDFKIFNLPLDHAINYTIPEMGIKEIYPRIKKLKV